MNLAHIEGIVGMRCNMPEECTPGNQLLHWRRWNWWWPHASQGNIITENCLLSVLNFNFPIILNSLISYSSIDRIIRSVEENRSSCLAYVRRKTKFERRNSKNGSLERRKPSDFSSGCPIFQMKARLLNWLSAFSKQSPAFKKLPTF